MAFNEFVMNYAEFGQEFFARYNVWGRAFLDFLHGIFDNMFYFFLWITVGVSLFFYFVSLYVALRKKQEKRHKFDEKNAPFVTVQIPTYNELAALRCAKKCLEFDYPKGRYEILIGDDSNDKEVSRQIDSFAEDNPQINVIRRGNNDGYKPGNLNNMLKYSKGEILVLFDSDFSPQPDFLKRIITPFMNDKKLAAVQARWNVMNAKQNVISCLGATIVWVCHHVSLPFIFNSRRIAMLCGSAEAVRKDMLIKLGGWDHGNMTEDIEYSLRLLKNGEKIVYLDNLECDSEVPYTLKDLYRQQMRWAFGVIYSFKKHWKDILRSRIIKPIDKFCITLACTGYFLSMLLAILFITGTLSFITQAPAPIDIPRFVSELGRNIVLTSGLLAISVVALVKSKNAKMIWRMIAASFSYGLIVTYFVNVGIIKALTNKPMKWYMLQKKGNIVQSE